MIKQYIFSLSEFISKAKNLIVLILLEILINILMFYILKDINKPHNYNPVVLDMNFSYSYLDVKNYFTAYTELDRIKYLYMEIVDMFYPIVYSFLLLGLLYKLFKNKLIIIVPLVAALFDYIENIFLLYYNLYFPDILAETVRISSIFTSLKWLFILLSLFILIIGVFIKLFKKY